MIRAMSRQAEAERDKRAKIINSEGEFMSAQKLAEAAEILGKHDNALQLRYLQVMTEIAAEKKFNSDCAVTNGDYELFQKGH